MAKKIEWSRDAIEDIISIAEYIEIDSKYYASTFVIELFEKAEALENFPKRGRIVPEFLIEKLREVFVGDYRLIYQINNNHITVVAVIYGSRVLKKVVKKRIK